MASAAATANANDVTVKAVACIDFGVVECSCTVFLRPAGVRMRDADVNAVDSEVCALGPGPAGNKQPCAVLVKASDASVTAFGRDAVMKFAEAATRGEARKYTPEAAAGPASTTHVFMDRLGTLLSPKRRARPLLAEEFAPGQQLLQVFVHVLKHMRTRATAMIAERNGGAPLADTDIGWLIEVPADLWDEDARTFIREAAQRGGLIAIRASAALRFVESSIDQVAAIDFGTSGCGFSFVFRPRGGVSDAAIAALSTSDLNTFTPGGAEDGPKELTAVLLDAATTEFIAFGRDARMRYANFCDDGVQHKYLYYERFKMQLAPARRRERPLLEMTISSGGRNEQPLILPFVKTLEYIKECVLDKVHVRLGWRPPEGRVGWQVTVPAIWDDEAKAFMREAATRAGIVGVRHSRQLQLALEPEGAALAAILSPVREARERMSKPGTKILVMDTGGGTVDITVSEVQRATPLQLREVMPPSGGAWGGTYVDRNFNTFLERLLGAGRYRSLSEAGKLSAACAWEETKHDYKPSAPGGLASVDLHGVMLDLNTLESDDGDDASASAAARPEPVTLQQLVAAYNARYGSGGATCECSTKAKSTRVRLSPQLTASFFQPLIDATIAHVRKLLAMPLASDVRFVLLVGGFAESEFMSKAVIDAFNSPTRTVIVPPAAGLCVVRGAALFGLDRDAFIVSRKARNSFGVRTAEPYDPALHAADVRYVADGEPFANFLYPLVSKDDDIPVRHRVELSGVPTHAADTFIEWHLYRLDVPLPRYEPGVRRMLFGGAEGRVPEGSPVATVRVDAGDPAVDVELRRVQITFDFGRTELLVRATNIRGEVVYATVEYTAGRV